MGVLSPVFRELQLEKHGLKWVEASAALAHPLPDGRAGVLHYSLEETARKLGEDGAAWRRTFAPFLKDSAAFFSEILRPIRVPSHPMMMARFGMTALRSAEAVIRRFRTDEARALFTGCAGHAILPLEKAGTASFGLVLALAGHAIGWPCARGGSQAIIDAMEGALLASGGKIEMNRAVCSLRDIPESRVVLFDLSPRQLANIAGEDLRVGFVRKLRGFKMGPGVFKVDWALSGPIPWKNPDCALAATVHVCGTAEEILESEREMGEGRIPEKPFVLLAQQSMFDGTRAPAGKHTGWAYCHVPAGCTVDMTEAIERQIERFAPGFRDLILARHTRSPAQYEAYNANFIGGDIGGGANTLMQFLFRPIPRWNPYTTPNPRLFLCSSSTPPGGGVHGMCGYWAAQAALKQLGTK
jgi:phytoene dehydrogenase-like protein